MNYKVKFSDMANCFQTLQECYNYIKTTKRLRRYIFVIQVNTDYGWKNIETIK